MKPTHAQLLARRITESGLPARQYAKQVLLRNERTVRRWLEGGKVPVEVVVFLQAGGKR